MRQSRKEIPMWKEESARYYHKAGWRSERIAEKLKLQTWEVVNIVLGMPEQETQQGHKTIPYYKDEMDYGRLARPEPLPKIKFVPGDLTLKDLAAWLEQEKRGGTVDIKCPTFIS